VKSMNGSWAREGVNWDEMGCDKMQIIFMISAVCIVLINLLGCSN
jgi:hypothetical protein